MIPMLFFPCIGLALLPSDLPKLLTQESFSSRDLAQAANYFVEMGEKKAAKKLAYSASDFLSDFIRANGPNNPKKTDFSLNSRLSWMCRILYEPIGKEPLKPAFFGEIISLPNRSMPSARWPIYPLVYFGETYFVLGDEYMLGGQPEPFEEYLGYCKAHGKFRTKSVTVPDRKQALKDFNLLVHSDKWKAIKWKDRGMGWSYTISEEWALKRIKAQAEGIPEK